MASEQALKFRSKPSVKEGFRLQRPARAEVQRQEDTSLPEEQQAGQSGSGRVLCEGEELRLWRGVQRKVWGTKGGRGGRVLWSRVSL